MIRYLSSWYIHDYLPDNFQRAYGTIDPSQLAQIAKEKMPSLPDEIFGWPLEILQIILGEIAGFSKPTIYNRVEIARAHFICSNRDRVDRNVVFNRKFPVGSLVPAILEHQPDFIVEVIDPMITVDSVFRFCPQHPDNEIIWRPPERKRK